MENFSEKELIQQAQAGKQYYLELLVKQYLTVVFSTAIRYLRNQADAEDATQEVFVKVWRNLSNIDVNRNFRFWILEITRNTCLDMLKKKKTVPFSAFEQEDGSDYFADSLADDGMTLIDFTEQSLRTRSLNGLIDKLSPKYQKVLNMHYNQDLNFREISVELHESLNTVKSRHRRAVNLLRKLLEKI
jgi:RNA polymerase sigma-70 factor, ECF subfamily